MLNLINYWLSLALRFAKHFIKTFALVVMPGQQPTKVIQPSVTPLKRCISPHCHSKRPLSTNYQHLNQLRLCGIMWKWVMSPDKPRLGIAFAFYTPSKACRQTGCLDNCAETLLLPWWESGLSNWFLWQLVFSFHIWGAFTWHQLARDWC